MKHLKKQFKLSFQDFNRSYIWDFFQYFLVFYGIVEIIGLFINESFIRNKWVLVIAIAFSLVCVFIKSLRLSRVSFDIDNTRVNIFFGDLLKQKGVIAIPINNFADTEIGERVAKTSIHGQFIEKVASGTKNCENLFATNLKNKGKELKTIRIGGLEIGYTINLEIKNDTYLLTVLSKTDKDTNVASANITDLITAFWGLWDSARRHANGRAVNVPLFGDGLSRIGLKPQQLLHILLITLVKEIHKSKITSTVNIVLYEGNFERISLKTIAEDLKYVL